MKSRVINRGLILLVELLIGNNIMKETLLIFRIFLSNFLRADQMVQEEPNKIEKEAIMKPKWKLHWKKLIKVQAE